MSFVYIKASVRRSGARPNLSLVRVLMSARRQSCVDLVAFSGIAITRSRVKAFQVFRLR